MIEQLQIFSNQSSLFDLLKQQTCEYLDIISYPTSSLFTPLYQVNEQNCCNIDINQRQHWIWSDSIQNQEEEDQHNPRPQENTNQGQLEQIIQARKLQQRMLENYFNKIKDDDQIYENLFKKERKNSILTEPGSPMRKNKKIKKNFHILQ